MATNFPYKIDDGLLYFRFPEAFKIHRLLFEKMFNVKKMKTIFTKFDSKGECILILFFRKEFLAMLCRYDDCPEVLPFRCRKALEALKPMKELLRSLGDETKDYSLNHEAMEEDMKFPPLKHQEQVFASYEAVMTNKHCRGMLIDAGPGTGKTYMSLTLTSGMIGVNTALIIAPLPTLRSVWESSIVGEKCLFKEEQYCYIIESNSVNDFKKDINIGNGKKYIILNYEKIDVAMKNADKLGLSSRTCVIVDESHNFGDPKSNRTVGLMELVEKIKPENILLLSGTPVKAKWREISVIRGLLDDRFFRWKKHYLNFYTRANFEGKMTLKEEYKDKSTVIAKSDMKLPKIHYKRIKVNLGSLGNQYTLEVMGEQLRQYAETRTKELTADTEKIMMYNKKLMEEVGMSAKQIDKYFTILNKFRRKSISDKFKDKTNMKALKDIEQIVIDSVKNMETRDKFKENCTILKFLELKVRGEALGKVYLGSRIQCYNDIINKIDLTEIIEDSIKKTVIFSSYISNCEAMVNKLEKNKKSKFKPVRVYGEYTKNLNQGVELFMKDETANPIVATYSSLSTGVELTSANTMVLIDLPYRAAEFEQTIARIWRYGQDEECFIYLIELDTGDKKNINQRTVDIVRYYDYFVMGATGHGVSQDLSQLQYDSYAADLVFESDSSGDKWSRLLTTPEKYKIRKTTKMDSIVGFFNLEV